MCKWDELYNAMNMLNPNYGLDVYNPFIFSNVSSSIVTSLFVLTTASFVSNTSVATYWPAPVSSLTGYVIGIGTNANQSRFYSGANAKFNSNTVILTDSMAFTKMKLQ